MTLPSSIGSASHFDQGSDDPKQARAQLKQIRDDIETINEHLKLSPFIARARAAASRRTLALICVLTWYSS